MGLYHLISDKLRERFGKKTKKIQSPFNGVDIDIDELKNVPKELKVTHRRRVISHVLSLVTWQVWLSSFLYILAIVSLGLLPLTRFHHNPNRVDENALLPGQTSKYFSTLDSHRYSTRLEELGFILPPIKPLDSNQILYNAIPNHADPPFDPLVNWLQQGLYNASLDVETQLFSYIDYSEDTAKTIFATNVYGILRAPRASGSEAILLSFPITTYDNMFNRDGLAFAITFAEFISRFSHWAKDIIIVFPVKNTLGMHAFLQAYHGILSPNLDKFNIKDSNNIDSNRNSKSNSHNTKSFLSDVHYSPLRKFSGVIEQAINIELLGHGEYTSFNLFMEGINGQLPNADAVLTLFKTLSYEGFPIKFHDIMNNRNSNSLRDEYLFAAESLVEFVSHQCTGIPRFAHALCIPFHIEAVTIRAEFDSGSWPRLRIFQIGKGIESAIRSFNNLLERLHHSYWFYFMAGPNSYVNMSVYLPPIIIMCLPLLMHAYYLWAFRPNTNPDEYVGEHQSVLVRPNPMLNAMPRQPIPIQGTPFYARPENVIHFSPVFRPLFVPFFTLGLVLVFGLLLLYWTPLCDKLISSGWLNPFIASLLGIGIFVLTDYFVFPFLQQILSVDSFSFTGLSFENLDKIEDDESESSNSDKEEDDDDVYNTDDESSNSSSDDEKKSSSNKKSVSKVFNRSILSNIDNDHHTSSSSDAPSLQRSSSYLESLANFDPEMPDPPAPMDKIADWVILKCLVCIIHASTLITVAMLNPSLAIVIGIPSIPAFLLASPLRIKDLLKGKVKQDVKETSSAIFNSRRGSVMSPAKSRINTPINNNNSNISGKLSIETQQLDQITSENLRLRRTKEDKLSGLFSYEVRDASAQDLAALALQSADGSFIVEEESSVFPGTKNSADPYDTFKDGSKSIGASKTDAKRIIDAAIGGPSSPTKLFSPGRRGSALMTPLSPSRRAAMNAMLPSHNKPKKYLLKIHYKALFGLFKEIMKISLLVISNPILFLAIIILIRKIATVILPSFITYNLETLFLDYSNGVGISDPSLVSRESRNLFVSIISLFFSLALKFPGIVDTWRLFGGWTYPYLACVYIPLNLALFIVLWMDPEDYDESDSLDLQSSVETSIPVE